MFRGLLKKVFRRSSKKPSKRMEDVQGEASDFRGEALDKLPPGHSEQAASIGVFHN